METLTLTLISKHGFLKETEKLSRVALQLSIKSLAHYAEVMILDWDESLTVKFRKPVQLGDIVEKAILDLVYPICGCMDYYVLNDDGKKTPLGGMDVGGMDVGGMKYCRAFPCSQIAAPGSAYCTEHTPARAPKQTDAFYKSMEWRCFRDWYIRQHPLCAMCEADGRLTPARIVDHIIEIRDGGAPLDESNCQSLCGRCHAIKTQLSKNHRKSTLCDRAISKTQS